MAVPAEPPHHPPTPPSPRSHPAPPPERPHPTPPPELSNPTPGPPQPQQPHQPGSPARAADSTGPSGRQDQGSGLRSHQTRRTLWLLATGVGLGALWAAVIIPRMSQPWEGPPFPAFAFVDFRDTVWHPIGDLVDGQVPYDVATYLQRHPQAQEFLLYLPSYFFVVAPLLALPYPVAVALWTVVLATCVTWLARRCLDLAAPGLLARRPALLVPAAMLFSLTPVINQPLRSGQLAIPCAVGAVVAITSTRPWAITAGTCVALVKPPVGLSLLLVLFCLSRIRPALRAVAISALLSLPVGIVVLDRLGGLGRAAEVALASVRFAGTSPYGGTGASASTRVDVIGVLGRIGVFPPTWVAAVLVLATLVVAAAVLLIAARRFPLHHPAVLAAATCTLVLVVPNELYGVIPMAVAAAVAIAAAVAARSAGLPMLRPALLASLLTVPFLNVHRWHDLIHLPPQVSNAVNGVAVLGALLVVLLTLARPSEGGPRGGGPRVRGSRGGGPRERGPADPQSAGASP